MSDKSTKPVILSIDDTPANLITLGAALGEDFDMQMASSGAIGLALAGKSPPDLILLDVMMPEMDGYETLRRLKADPALASIPVIFITALTGSDAESAGLALGAADYITKPINVEIARRRISNLLERERLRKEVVAQRDHLEEVVAARTLALSIAKEEAESANRAKTVFLANTSHELRTPMSAIVGMTELARRRATDPKQVDYLDKVSRASAALLALINGILDCASLEANQLTLEHRSFKLAGVVENLAGLFEGQALQKGLLLSIEIEAGLANQSLLGDPLRLGQILQNLTDNAIKFTAQGFVIVELGLVEETASAMQVRFGVRDTGIGISLADQRRIFDNFEQADGSLTRRYGGSGLGLGLCRQLAGLMGGEIGVDSQPGAGANFWLTARLQKADAAVMID